MERVGAGLTHRSQQTRVTVRSQQPTDVCLHLFVHRHPGRLPPGEGAPGGEVPETEVVRRSSLGLDGEVEHEGGGYCDAGVEVRQGDGGPQVEADRSSWTEMTWEMFSTVLATHQRRPEHHQRPSSFLRCSWPGCGWLWCEAGSQSSRSCRGPPDWADTAGWGGYSCRSPCYTKHNQRLTGCRTWATYLCSRRVLLRNNYREYYFHLY